MPTQIFDIFLQCYQAIRGGELIKRQSVTDKEFHFQNWFEARLQATEGHITLILPVDYPQDDRLVHRGDLTRIECEHLVVGYNFDLRTNELTAETIPNPMAGTEHRFVAYRPNVEPGPTVTLVKG